jgi:hypothetical protein
MTPIICNLSIIINRTYSNGYGFLLTPVDKYITLNEDVRLISSHVGASYGLDKILEYRKNALIVIIISYEVTKNGYAECDYSVVADITDSYTANRCDNKDIKDKYALTKNPLSERVPISERVPKKRKYHYQDDTDDYYHERDQTNEEFYRESGDGDMSIMFANE